MVQELNIGFTINICLLLIMLELKVNEFLTRDLNIQVLLLIKDVDYPQS